jgi:segregation and condensation protein B
MTPDLPEQPDDAQESAASAFVHVHPRADRNQNLRIIEAILFAAEAPVPLAKLQQFFSADTDVEGLLKDLQENYTNRGVNLVQVAGNWTLRTAEDLSFVLRRETVEQKRLSKAALETLAIVAYHQPVTRADIEDIRGVAISKGTLDILMEIGWVKMRGRRRTPGRPVTYGTTEAFLSHFGLNEVVDLPGLAELKGAGLLDANLPPDFEMPTPRSGDELTAEEDPLDGDEQMPLEMHLPDLALAPPEAEAAPPPQDDNEPDAQ